jgi:hypothetical protein
MQLYVTGRKWCDYFGFNPNFEPCYFKLRVYPDIDTFQRLDEALRYGTQLLLKRKQSVDTLLKQAVA